MELSCQLVPADLPLGIWPISPNCVCLNMWPTDLNSLKTILVVAVEVCAGHGKEATAESIPRDQRVHTACSHLVFHA